MEIVLWIQAIFMVGMLVMLAVALARLDDTKARLEALWKTDSDLLNQACETYCRVDNVHSIVNTKPAGRFTVMVVGQNMDGSPFAWGVTDTIAWFEEKQLQVPIEVRLRKGAVIVCVGEAELREVLVGHHAQTPWMNGGAPMCITQQDTEVGQRITVRVRSTKV